MKKLFALVLLLASGQAYAEQACTQTFSSLTGLAAAIGSAANGSVICLDSGTYGALDLFDYGRSGYVTLRSTTGTGATLGYTRIGNSDYIRLRNISVTGLLVNSCSLNIQLVNVTVPVDASGILFDASSCPSSTHNYLVDGATLIDVGMANYEGRLNCRDCNGVIIRNSLFSGIGSEPSDGIQFQGGTKNVTIIGNTFSDILESQCGAVHCDAIQLQGNSDIRIAANYFKNGDTFIMSPDGCTDVTVEDNIFDGNGVSYEYKFQMGSCASPIIRHNVFRQVGVAVDSKVGESASSNALIENNIFSGSLSGIKLTGGSGCTSCIVRYNMFTDSAAASGTNQVSGPPTFIAGVTSPTTWAGWELASGSNGENAGNDGKNVGSLYFNPAAPGNFTSN